MLSSSHAGDALGAVKEEPGELMEQLADLADDTEMEMTSVTEDLVDEKLRKVQGDGDFLKRNIYVHNINFEHFLILIFYHILLL